jgi:hypothetical protein
MFNNNKYKNTRLADTSLRDTVSDLASGYGVGQSDEIAKKALTKFNPGQIATKVKPSANIAGMAAGIAADPLINLGEALLTGPAKMYSSRMSDAIKNIAAIKKLIPNDPNLTALLDSLSQQMNSGAQSFTAKTNNQPAPAQNNQPTPAQNNQAVNASYNNKINRVAVIGDPTSNLGDYGRQALIGAGSGALLGGPLGMLTGAIGGLASAAAGDVVYQFKNNAQKASWNAGEMQEKLGTMADQLQKANPQVSIMLRKLGQDVKNYIEVTHEKKRGANMKNSYDKELQQMQQGQQGQQGQQKAPSIEQDPQISQGVEYLMGIYQQGMQFYNSGDAQNYNTYKLQYTQGLQNLNQYIVQKYPNQDPNVILGQYLQQQQQMQQQMQQQGNTQQPQ